jgi:hypothetical protein
MSNPDVLERVLDTIRRSGLDLTDFRITTTIDDQPLVIAETLNAYAWANHLRLRLTWYNGAGDAQFKGVANGIHFAFLYTPSTHPVAYRPTAIDATQALPAVA